MVSVLIVILPLIYFLMRDQPSRGIRPFGISEDAKPAVALTARVFGREIVGIMFGWIVAAHQVGAARAAWGAGLI